MCWINLSMLTVSTPTCWNTSYTTVYHKGTYDDDSDSDDNVDIMTTLGFHGRMGSQNDTQQLSAIWFRYIQIGFITFSSEVISRYI